MWCVKRVGAAPFAGAYHLVSEVEARELQAVLNGRSAAEKGERRRTARRECDRVTVTVRT